ncbi:hypothetical protein [Alkalihalobacillus sp. AL-G]|uniref:hypothetical protein n=1 Tax=Alkalihalobacillus sp. AL-G TaxID=2926399 RepID=UPI00272BF18C|nr:hypothetical protein [Alkalihalobacillus sp. AL-G]WLD93861.1 hypothetical protein MOJ78_02790 [Alkalihalobacillus sp. AL-G]
MKDDIQNNLRNLPKHSLNNEQKQRILVNLSSEQTDEKVTKRRTWKPLLAGITSLVLLCFLSFYTINEGGLFNTANDSRTELNELVDQFPEIENDVKELPEGVRNKIKVPTIESIPFEVISVQVSPTKNPVKNKVLLVNVMFNGENRTLHVTTFWDGFRKEFIDNEDVDKIVELETGETAGWIDKEHAKLLRWYSEEQKQSYDLMIIVFPDIENSYTKEDLLEIANSMY